MVLTERDKKLLYFLAVVVMVAVFGVLLILPQWEKHTKLQDELQTAQINQADMEASIASLDSITKNNAIAKKDYETASKDFYEVMESHAAERMITQIVLSHNLTTSTFDISTTPQQAEMTAYIASQLGQSQGVTADQALEAMNGGDEKTTDTKEEESTGEEETVEESVNDMYVDYITLTASGSTDNMKALIDDLVNNYPSMLVTSYSMSTGTGLTTTNRVVDVSQVSIGLNLYMVDKSLITADEQSTEE